MSTDLPRWRLWGTSTNDHGTRFFQIDCRDEMANDGDFHELMSVLERDFGAVKTGELAGPYSLHVYVTANDIPFAIILDDPGWLALYASDERDVPALELLVTSMLEALNKV